MISRRFGFLAAAMLAAASTLPAQPARERLINEVRRELVMMPLLNVFDHLSYRVDGAVITLLGSVTRPTLKADAERLVKRIEGVEKVVNNIEVLPVSPQDDRIRLAVYRAIYNHPALNRYAIRAIPPVHIIVKNGNVALEGVVLNKADRDIAGIQANQVPGVFAVTNNLVTEK